MENSIISANLSVSQLESMALIVKVICFKVGENSAPVTKEMLGLRNAKLSIIYSIMLLSWTYLLTNLFSPICTLSVSSLSILGRCGRRSENNGLYSENLVTLA